MNRVRELERAEAELKGQEAAMNAEYARAGEGIGETKMQSLSVSRGAARADRSRSQGHAEQAFGDTPQARGDAGAAGTFTGSRAGDGASRRASGLHRRRRGRARSEADGRCPGRTRADHSGSACADRRGRCFPGPEGPVRFLSIHNRSLPLFTGTVRTVSADSFTDEKTGNSYFRAEIVVPESRTQPRSLGPRPGRAPARSSRRGGAESAHAPRCNICWNR